MKIKFWLENEIQESEINPDQWILWSEGTETCIKFTDDYTKELWRFEARIMVVKKREENPEMQWGQDFDEDPEFIADENLRASVRSQMSPKVLLFPDQDLSGIPEDNWYPSRNPVNLSMDSIGIGGGGSHWTR